MKTQKIFGIFSIGLIAILGLLITGCGQSIPTISTSTSTIPQPKGLTIRGVVYGNTLDANRGNPLEGVSLALNGDSANKTATTNSKGEFVFTDLPANDASSSTIGYNITAVKDGYQRNITSGVSFGSLTQPADNSILTVDIDMDGDPVVLSLTPAPGSVIETNASITVVFNEAMDTTTVLPGIVATGLRTLSAEYTINVTTSWSEDKKTLTITPKTSLTANLFYKIAVDPSGIAKDSSGNKLETTAPTNSGGLDSAVYNQSSANYYYRASTGGVPGAPSNLSISVGTNKYFVNDATTGADYSDIYGATSINILWPAATGNISGYRIYIANSTNNYHLLATTTTNTNYYDTSMSNIISALFGSGVSVDPLATGNYPAINTSLYIKVVAYNGDGESTAAETNVRDLMSPRLSTTVKTSTNWSSGAVLQNNYFLPAITDTKVAYIAFREPVNETLAGSKDNYSIAGGNITSATVMTNSSVALTSFAADAYTIVKILADVDVSGKVITAKPAILDLSGNAVKAGTNDTVTP